MSALVSGCGHDQGPRPTDADLAPVANSTGGSTGGGLSPAETGGAGGAPEGGTGGSSGGAPGGAGGAPTCGESTATNIEGPFFLPNSPERTDIRGNKAGPRLLLSGVVLGPDCAPIEGALVDFWQADEDGVYDNEGDTFRGHQRTDSQGRYQLESIIPGRYLNGAQYRPAHIHVKVSAGGQTLTTQLYFPGDPFNDLDAFIDFSLIVTINRDDQNGVVASFDFMVTAR